MGVALEENIILQTDACRQKHRKYVYNLIDFHDLHGVRHSTMETLRSFRCIYKGNISNVKLIIKFTLHLFTNKFKFLYCI